MAEITYLFGAGASAKALPVVKDFPKKFSELIKKLESEPLKLPNKRFHQLNLVGAKTQSSYQKDLINLFKWIQEQSVKHASIDTYAKKLFLRSEFKKLRELKVCLTIFFSFFELVNPPDFRYDAFYASILNHRYKFPENINILSWNYDNQFEISFLEYIDENSISIAENHLMVKSKLNWNDYDPGFGIYKLNGSTSFRKADDPIHKTKVYDFIKKEVDLELVTFATLCYARSIDFDELDPSISFAWENDLQHSNIVENARNHIVETEVLVVIGYSFPFFNRDVDRKIIGSLNNLKKVYFQSPEAENLKQRFLGIRNDLSNQQLVSVTDLEQFYLPNEL